MRLRSFLSDGLYDIGCTLSRFGLAGIGICTGRAIAFLTRTIRWCASNMRIDFFSLPFSFLLFLVRWEFGFGG